MDIVKYDWRLSPENPFVYDWQQYRNDFSFSGYDMHGDLHLLILLKGKFQTMIGKESFVHCAGNLILIAPWEIHGNYAVEADTELLSITVFGSSLRSGLSALSPQLDSLLQLPPKKRMQLLNEKACYELTASYAERLFSSKQTVFIAEEKRLKINAFEFSTIEKAFEFIRIQELFAGILQYIEPIDTSGGKHTCSLKLTPALQMLESAEAVPLSSTLAAEKCNLSSGYFNLLFKKLYGISFYNYELQYRLRRAEADLQSGQYSIKEIALRHGFADSSHFSRTFKKYYATAPSDYLPQHPQSELL